MGLLAGEVLRSFRLDTFSKAHVIALGDWEGCSVTSWKSAVSLVLVCAAGVSLLIPQILLVPPRNTEVWILETLRGMHGTAVPLLGQEIVKGVNPLALLILSLMQTADITVLRLLQAGLGFLLVGTTFLLTLGLFGLASAVTACLLTITSLGFPAMFGTLNTNALPVLLTTASFGVFSLAYTGRLARPWFIVSYTLAALALVTGSTTTIAFFVLASLLLVMLDLAPTRLFSIHIATGVAIILAALAVYLATYRVIMGPGFAWESLCSGGQAGFARGAAGLVQAGIPWIFLLVPAFVQLGGPSSQESWRSLLPPRIACALAALMSTFWPGAHDTVAVIFVPFASILVGEWISHGMGKTARARAYASWMSVAAFAAVFAAFLIVLVRPVFGGEGFTWMRWAWAGALASFTVIFSALAMRHRIVPQIVVVALSAACVILAAATTAQTDRWYEKLSFMMRISTREPLVVYDDDLVMRGYLSVAGARPIVVGRDAVPMGGKAFLAVCVDDLDRFVSTKNARRLNCMVIERFTDLDDYALVAVGPPGRLR